MKVFYKKLLFILTFFPLLLSAQNNFWREITNQTLSATEGKRMIYPAKFLGYSLDTIALKKVLQNAPAEFTPEAHTKPLVIALPLPDGTIEHFSIVKTRIMEPELSAKFPGFQNFNGQGVEDPSATLQMDWTSIGFHAQIFSALKEQSMYVDPYALGNNVNYLVYSRDALPFSNQESKESGTEGDGPVRVGNRVNAGICFDSLRIYRLAVAATADYTRFFGSRTNAQAAIDLAVNRVNGIYERELGIRLVLVSNNNLIVYDSLSDPYPRGLVDSNVAALNQASIDAVIGKYNYDIGHLFTTVNGGRFAVLGSVFDSSKKARAITSRAMPYGDAYYVDYVAHEIGHQFGATHTFNDTSGSCRGTRSAATAVEPGSGVTIMAFAGTCGVANNLQANNIPHFHTVSQGQIRKFIDTARRSIRDTVIIVGAIRDTTITRDTTIITRDSTIRISDTIIIIRDIGTRDTIIRFRDSVIIIRDTTIVIRDTVRIRDSVISIYKDSVISTGNTAPVVNAGADYTIPISTPFVLTGSATDASTMPRDFLTYSWEEIDIATAAGNWNSGSPPFFRSFRPATTPTRYFPRLVNVANNNTITGERLPDTIRTLNFKLTVRDNRTGGGGVCSDTMSLRIAGTTPFRVTSQAADTTWISGNNAIITWNKAGTDSTPFNTPKVTILFSADGGITFPYVLRDSTANDGVDTVRVPNISTRLGRVMVKAVGNVFFSKNTAFISIIPSDPCRAEGTFIAPEAAVNTTPGNPGLNLNLSPQYSQPFSPTIGTITNTDSATILVCRRDSNTCTTYTNPYLFDVHPFTVTMNGLYTFTDTVMPSTFQMRTVFNLYANSFSSVATTTALCTNQIASSLIGATVSPSVTATLTAGVNYFLVQGAYGPSSNTLPNFLPVDYKFMVTPPTGGAIYKGGLPLYIRPDNSYSYAYIVVNNTTNRVISISPTADLRNDTTYPIGAYTVYGISYRSSDIIALRSLINGTFSNFANAIAAGTTTYCANISKNSVSVTISNTLPVQFLPLAAKKLTKNSGLLQWGTASETNTSHFEIERSSNGREFTTIPGKIPAAGNSNMKKNYSFTDNSPLKGPNYYRIRQVDKDGKSAHSNIASLNFNGDGAISIYPNPATSLLTIEYADLVPGKMQLQVIDGKGAVIINQSQQVIIGMNTTKVNVASLPTGMYTLKCTEANGITHITKFMKQQ